MPIFNFDDLTYNLGWCILRYTHFGNKNSFQCRFNYVILFVFIFLVQKKWFCFGP